MSRQYVFMLIIIVMVVIVAIPIIYLKDRNNEIYWDFKGPIQKVTFGDDRVIDTLVVNGKVYQLAGIKWADFNVNVKKGDTAIKKKGNKYIKFIKVHSKDTIYYNKEF